jgi:prepilin-type N-terminal cleavage/methylation domain-containing protein
MIKRNNKKGFTIVELVIVIAVIAILAAVLIPTFSSIIAKANQSADISAVTQMNKVLAGNDYKDISEVAKALTDNGFNADDTLVPVSKDHAYYWFPEYNMVILVDESTWKLVAPISNTELVNAFNATTKESNAFVNLKVTGAKIDVSDSASIDTALSAGQNITLTATPEKITTSNAKYESNGRPAGMLVPEDAVVAIDLGGQTLEAEPGAVALAVKGEAVITNGTISTRSVVVEAGGKLTIGEDVKIIASATDGGQCVRNLGGVVTINGATLEVPNAAATTDHTRAPGAIYNTGYMVINNCKITTNSPDYAINSAGGMLIINNANIDARRGCVLISGGSAVINGGTFTSHLKDSAYALYIEGDAVNSTLEINGGTFNNAEGGYDVYIKGGKEVKIKAGLLSDPINSYYYNAN